MRHRVGRFGPPAAVGAVLVLLGSCVAPPPAPAPPIVRSFAVAGAPFSAPALVPFAWSVQDVNGDALTCRLDGDGDGTWELTMEPCQASGSRNLPANDGDYTATFQVFDASHAPVTATAAYSVSAGPTETFDIVAIQTGSADPRVDEAIESAAALWESVVSRGIPDMEVQHPAGSCGPGSPEVDGSIDDQLIFVTVQPDIGNWGLSYPCVSGPDELPRLGSIQLLSAPITWLYDNGYLDDLIAHEMGHALGLDGTLWWNYRVDTGAERLQFTGPRAVAEWSRLGGVGTIPLNQGTDHWSEDDLQSELMTCGLENLTDHPLSTITAGAVADIGYHVDLAATQAYTIPTEAHFMTC